MITNETKKEKKNTEEEIMLAAESVFLEKGYSLATTTAIAERAGVTHAMLHYYYRTKEQIFFKVLDKNLNDLFSHVRQAMSLENTSFWAVLKGGVELLLDFLYNHRQLAGLLYDVSKQSPELIERYKESTVKLLCGLVGHHKLLLEREVDEGRCNRVAFEQLFFSIVMMCFSTYMFVPVMNNVLGLPVLETDAFLKRRHAEIIDMLYHRLYGRVDGETGT